MKDVDIYENILGPDVISLKVKITGNKSKLVQIDDI